MSVKEREGARIKKDNVRGRKRVREGGRGREGKREGESEG